MGHYTEFYIRATLRKDTPRIVVAALQSMVGDLKPEQVDWSKTGLDADTFQIGARGTAMLCFHCSIDPQGKSIFSRKSADDVWGLEARTEIKNYDDEIGKFLDWVRPYLCQQSGEFIGWSLLEDRKESPVLYFASGGDQQAAA